MRRFGGLVVGALLLTGCGAGGGLASTTASAVSSATTTTTQTTTTLPPTAAATSTSTTAIVTSRPSVSDATLAVQFTKAVLTGDQQTVGAMAFGQKIDPYYRQFALMSAPAVEGKPTDYHNGRMGYTVAAKVKTKDGTLQVLKLSLVMDSHQVIGYSSGLYDPS